MIGKETAAGNNRSWVNIEILKKNLLYDALAYNLEEEKVKKMKKKSER